MTAIIFILPLLALVTLFSCTHGIGLWLLLMIIHGIIYNIAGHGSEHLPFFTGLILVAIIFVKRQWSGVPMGVMFLFLAMIMLMGISALLGIEQDTGLMTLIVYARGFLLVLLLAGALKNEKDMKIMTLYCLAGLTIGALAAVYQYKTGKFAVQTIYDQRASSLRGDPNDTAMLLVAGIPFAFYWLMNSKAMLVKAFFSLTMIVLLFGIVLTGSRGGFVALLAIMLIMFLRKPSLKVFMAGILLSASFFALAPHSYWSRMDTLITRHEEHGGSSLQKRAKLQNVGLEILAENPAFGVGPGNFGLAFSNHIGGMQRSVGGGVAHNMYLEFFVENGLLGGLLFLSIFTMAIASALKFDRVQGTPYRQFGLGFSIALALFGMLFSGLFLSQAKNSVLWFTTGMALTAGLYSSKIKKDDYAYDAEACEAVGYEAIGYEAANFSQEGKLP